jgi:hypothetical protein
VPFAREGALSANQRDARPGRLASQRDEDEVIDAFVPSLPALERELRAHRSHQSEIDLRLVRAPSLVFTTAQCKPQSRRNARAPQRGRRR